MTTKTENTVSIADKAIAVIALAVVVAGVYAYYYFINESVLLRAPMVAAGFLGGLFVFYQSNLGKQLWKFVQISRVEIRKVVWPTRQDAVRDSIIVIVFTLIFGAFFWVLDLVLRSLARMVA